MKKSLIALAALSAIAGAAQAQSSVEIYGLIDMSVNTVQEKATGQATIKQTMVGAASNAGGSTSGNGHGDFAGSRIGFRGTEDLGGGLKAGFVYELGVNYSGSGAATTASTQNTGYNPGFANVRQAHINVSSQTLGTIYAGTLYAMTDATNTDQAGVAAQQAHGGTNHLQGAAQLLKFGNIDIGGNPRMANSVAYKSPTVAGFTVRALLNAGESQTTGINNGDGRSFGIDYVGGAFKAGFAQTKLKNVLEAGGAATTPVNTSIFSTSTASLSPAVAYGLSSLKSDQQFTVFGGQYNFGFANVGLHHSDAKNTPVGGAAGGFHGKANSVSAMIPVPQVAGLSIRTAYTVANTYQDGVKSYDADGTDLAAWYDLSKRTALYAVYTNGEYKGKKGTDNNIKYENTIYGVGVRHLF